METDNPTGPEPSIEDRLAASFAAEAEETAPEPVAEESDDSEPSMEADEQPAEGEELLDIEDDDGVPHKVPAKLKDAFLRRQDYTRKTMQAANLAEAAQDRLQFAEAREQFQQHILAEVADVRALQGQLRQLEALDMSQLYTSDPATALRVRDQREDLRRQIQERESQIGQKARWFQSKSEEHNAKQWQTAVEGAKARIGTFTPGEDAAMLKQAQAVGFTEKELKGRYADPRILHLIYKAAKWDTLQANKGKAVETAKAAPPVLKPGASKGANVAAEQKFKDARQALKKSGDVRDAARLFMLRG